MSMLANIIGGAVFGLTARVMALGIQKRGIWSNPVGHLAAMGVYGYAGYWVWWWEIRSEQLIQKKIAEIETRRQEALEYASSTYGQE